MNPLLTALAITAASILPVSAGIHDFSPANAAPTPTRVKARVGQGRCSATRDNSQICYLTLANNNYSIAIRDVDKPSVIVAAHIDCNTGRWRAMGPLTKHTLDLYLGRFCTKL